MFEEAEKMRNLTFITEQNNKTASFSWSELTPAWERFYENFKESREIFQSNEALGRHN